MHGFHSSPEKSSYGLAMHLLSLGLAAAILAICALLRGCG